MPADDWAPRHLSSISGRMLEPLLLILRQRGHGVEGVCNAAGISEADAGSAALRISEVQLRDALTSAIEVSGDPAIALRAGLSDTPGQLGPLGHVLRNAATIGQACTLLLHYWRLVYDESVFSIQGRGDLAVFRVRRDEHANPEVNRPLIEYLLAQLLRLIDTLSGLQDRPWLHQIDFRHRRPATADLAAYPPLLGTRQFGFGSEANAVHFDARLLTAPIALADAALLQTLKRKAEAELRALALEPELRVRVRVLLRRRLLGCTPSVSTIAADCGMSRATLQRRLADVGSNFSAELLRVRYELANEMLQRDQLSLSEIAYTLGYCDAAAFHHAYSRWAGQTPGQYRASSHVVT